MTDERKGARGGKASERRYGKPADGAQARKADGKPARVGSARPAGNAGPSERRYGKPAGGSEGRVPGGRPARIDFVRPAGNAGPSERRYGKPAGGSEGRVPGGKPARVGFARPAGNAGPSERRYGKPADGSEGRAPGGKPARVGFARPAGNAGPKERRYGKPADGAEGRAPGGKPARVGFARPAGDAGPSERRYGKPADGKGRPAPVKREPEPGTGLSMTARRVALDVLCDVHQRGAYAALSLDERLRAARLRPEDRRLVTNIVYGALEEEIRIDYALDRLMEHPTREPVQRDILRLSAYQILFLDRVPDSAAVNEAVKLVKGMGMEEASGFINAVLRNLSRGKEEMAWPAREDDEREYLHIMGSMPTWIIDRLADAYGMEEAGRIVMHRESGHPVVVRPNLARLTDREFSELLEKKAWRTEPGLAPHAWLVYGASEITLDRDYQGGLFSIQGQSSMLAAEAVQARPGMKVLDACAAPGGKSAYLCERMQLTGRVYAWELHEKRARLLEGVKRRLGLDNLRVSVRDAGEHRPDLDGTMDAVLLDAPCSGLGVMAQKPDIKLRVKEEDLPAIVAGQKRLLDTLCRYVKPGGTLVYSTCSVLPEENAEQVKAFLEEHPEFCVEPLPLTYPEKLRGQQTPLGLQLLGYRDGVEGFFIARMRRNR